MKNELAINAAADPCGGCASTGCATCASSPNDPGDRSTLSRRQFGRTLAAGSAAAFLLGCSKSPQPAGQTATPAAAPAVDPNLAAATKSRGPIMTVLEEFYKMGPGPSSSHTMGPMRITYDFYQRLSALP